MDRPETATRAASVEGYNESRPERDVSIAFWLRFIAVSVWLPRIWSVAVPS